MNAFKKFDLTGKTAFVTGGGAGLGFNLARGLAQAGAKVMIAARREEVLQASAEKLSKESDHQVLYTTIDLSDRKNTAKAAAYANKMLSGVDIFVGNAALDRHEPIDNINSSNVDDVMQVNFTANVELTRLFLPYMREQKWGRIIYCSSITAIRGSATEGMSVYAATKGAINAFARVAASEAGHDNITVNSLNLGVYMTDMLEGVIKTVGEAHGAEVADGLVTNMSSMTSLGRLGKVEEVEGVIQFLASDAGSYVTGSHMVIDGGMSANMKANMPESH